MARLILTALVHGLAFVALANQATAKDSAQTAAPFRCVLDIYGAMTPPRMKTPEVSLILRYDGRMQEMLDPASILYEYNPVVRARLINDNELQSLFGPGAIVRIVRHDELFNFSQVRNEKFITRRSEEACQAELIISDVIALWPPPTLGPVLGALVGKSRITVGFLFRRSSAQGGKTVVTYKRVGGRIPPIENLQANMALYRSAMQVATSAAFAEFLGNMSRNSN